MVSSNEALLHAEQYVIGRALTKVHGWHLAGQYGIARAVTAKSHIITTTLKKQAYSLVTEGNRTKVEKFGLVFF